MRARLRYWQAVLQCWSYVVRPYDMLADRRRWFWQRSTPCGRQVAAQLTNQQLEALQQATSAALARAKQTGFNAVELRTRAEDVEPDDTDMTAAEFRAAFARGVTTRDECEHGRYRDTCGWCM